MKQSEKRLLKLYSELSEEDQRMLLAFAEFLHARGVPERMEPLPPQPIPRPAQETVIAALKRLSQSYPMLDKARMLNETSVLVAQHVMQGRAAGEVIDELEVIFERHYRTLASGHRQDA